MPDFHRSLSSRVALAFAILASLFIFSGKLFAVPGALSMSRSVAEAGLPALYAAGDTYPAYTVDSAAKSSITAGTYSEIVMGDGFDKFTIPSGQVTLVGGAGGELVSTPLSVAYRSTLTQIGSSPIMIGSTGAAASLTLLNGSLTGDIAIGAGNRSRRDAALIIGDGSTPATVNITGSILGYLNNGSTYQSALRVDGADLNITGNLGIRSGVGNIGLVDAGGNITISANSSLRNVLGNFCANRVNIRAGKKIEAAGLAFIRSAFLSDGSSLVTNGAYEGQAGRIDISYLIDGGVNGLLSEGSKIKSSNGSVWLWQGMTEGDGEISAGASIGSHTGEGYPSGEAMVPSLLQGSGKLTLTAGKDISTGDMTVDSFSAGNDVISGTEFSSSLLSADRVYK